MTISTTPVATRLRIRRATLFVTIAVMASGTPAAKAAPQHPRITWSKCAGQFECGSLRVPLDYDRLDGATISLALTRLPATDPARRLGSLFINPGGPGGSGVEFVQAVGEILFTSEVRARFDLVGFDPRGIARSTALRCFGTEKQWAPAFTDFAFPTNTEEEARWAQADAYVAESCEQRGGALASHMATANVARDLDSMRRAVRDPLLNYYGISYGSYLGTTYANMFPGKVGRLIVDGVLDPIAWSTGNPGEESLPFSTRLRSAVGSQASLGEFFRLCDAGVGCAFAPDSATRFAALADQLKTAPVTLTFPDGYQETFGYSHLVGVALGAMYYSGDWPDFAQLLADLEAGATGQAVAQRARALRGSARYLPKRGPVPYYNAIEGFPAVACADSDNPTTYADWSSAAALAAQTQSEHFGPLWTWITSICAPWSKADSDRYMGPFTRATANPVLVIGNLFDPATPYHGAQRVAELLPNSALLTLHGWAHGAFLLSACIDDAVADYLLVGQTPAADAVCEQDFIPFAA